MFFLSKYWANLVKFNLKHKGNLHERHSENMSKLINWKTPRHTEEQFIIIKQTKNSKFTLDTLVLREGKNKNLHLNSF